MQPALLCLHGWGGSKESFTELRQALEGSGVEIFTPDLPGFGAGADPPKPWTVDDYAAWVEDWARRNGLADRPLFLLGHSHGGRTAIKMVIRGNLPIKHLFLCASAGIRHPRHIKRIIGLTLAKAGKTLLEIPGLKKLAPQGKAFLYKLVRVHDYEQASPVMRETMIRVSAEDLRPHLKNIRVPTDIFWGTDDGMTPYADAKVMEREIHGSLLHTFPGVRHRVHRDKAPEIAAVILERTKGLETAANGGVLE